jgi:hypothetical protein
LRLMRLKKGYSGARFDPFGSKLRDNIVIERRFFLARD